MGPKGYHTNEEIVGAWHYSVSIVVRIISIYKVYAE